MMNPNSRTENVTLTMTVYEKEFFSNLAKEENVTLCEYIRRKLYKGLKTSQYTTTRGIVCTRAIKKEDIDNV